MGLPAASGSPGTNRLGSLRLFALCCFPRPRPAPARSAGRCGARPARAVLPGVHGGLAGGCGVPRKAWLRRPRLRPGALGGGGGVALCSAAVGASRQGWRRIRRWRLVVRWERSMRGSALVCCVSFGGERRPCRRWRGCPRGAAGCRGRRRVGAEPLVDSRGLCSELLGSEVGRAAPQGRGLQWRIRRAGGWAGARLAACRLPAVLGRPRLVAAFVPGLWQAPALEGALSSERSLVLCGTVPLRRVPGARWDWQHRRREGAARSEHAEPSGRPAGLWCCWVGSVPRGWAASHGDGRVPSEAAGRGGCERRGQTEARVPPRDAPVPEPLRPARSPPAAPRRARDRRRAQWGGQRRLVWGSGDPVVLPGPARHPAERGLARGLRRTRCSSSPFPSSLCLPRTPVLPAKR